MPGEYFIEACLNDINMLNVTKGCVRTFDEYKILFDTAGFSINKTESVEDALYMIELEFSERVAFV